MTTYLHFAIGPVQGFVAQARRTRDLWGGSYLLSFLSAHAMRRARAAGAIIKQPLVDDDRLLRWVEQRSDDVPRYGSLPNQFTAQLTDGSDPKQVADAIADAVHATWREICDAVWQRHVARIEDRGDHTRAIWDRQTQGFWDLTWVAGEQAHGLLDRRKFWRTHRLPEEGGDKCTVMPELQELSGHLRSHNRERQDEFWATLRSELGQLELRDYERLCALALIKRLYATAAQRVVGKLDVKRWPSTVDVAAAPWVQRALRVAPREAATYAAAVAKVAGDDTLTGGVSSLVVERPATGQAHMLGANWFHRGFAASPRLAPLEPANETAAVRKSLLDQLKALTDVTDADGKLGEPPIYYALLLADGDSLGKLLLAGGGELASRALADFTSGVDDLVRRYSGSTIYAGGDDVLAILSVDRALDCAHDIEQKFARAFRDARFTTSAAPEKARLAADDASLSVAVMFAHARSPLHRVLHEAHHLLDDVAKDQNGRASIAAAIYRGDSVAAQWVTTWRRDGLAQRSADEPTPTCDHGATCAVACVTRAVRELSRDGETLSSSLLHDLRHMLHLLCGDIAGNPGHFAELADQIDEPELTGLVRAEIHHRLARRGHEPTLDDLERLTTVIRDLLHRSHRTSREGTYELHSEPRNVGTDGLVLASFLANGGREDDHAP
jgi:CRISPR-associated protein Cmr2